ncbi:hypothetical protein [Lysobacter gummosus]|uniref:Uncharacterized protein n=1 Tax=Lysobacter gummosus TaxID=262324 RepID=A0ABY3X8X4_9GAMM|nr:hypothetical protein [Lysobacter gummosus]UNP29043.1 hypothetical protein MOV92_21655 [Lysobacter gummosus]
MITPLQQGSTTQFVNMESELAFWRAHYRRLGCGTGLRFADYEPAIKLGLDAYVRGNGRDFQELQEELLVRYARTRGGTRLDWSDAVTVVESAWRRLCRYPPFAVREPKTDLWPHVARHGGFARSAPRQQRQGQRPVAPMNEISLIAD